MVYAGIDIGSLTTETVILDEKGELVSSHISSTGPNGQWAAERSFRQAQKAAGLSTDQIRYVVATGYGRGSAPMAHKTITEITCHGRGAHFLFPKTRIVIDVGGQDSKVIKLGPQGNIINFVMNDKCAAGTGRFLEVMAQALEISLEAMGPLSLKSHQEIAISSMCTVFAESEVISLVAQARSIEDILNGLHQAISYRLTGMLDQMGVEPEVTMSGGVAKNIGIVHKIQEKLGLKINIPKEPQIVGALGAALIAWDMAAKEKTASNRDGSPPGRKMIT
ncbi:MAG: 2-hydroxyglutaryl-CoA dehydratase [Desulfobacca sp.]|nr:2-hydroxyglutaryl-CoA dehydratase [Desulfobacca sp.]